MRDAQKRGTVNVMYFFRAHFRRLALMSVFALGAFLRILFAATHPYWIHAYDWQGHQQYIFYVVETGRIPPAIFGWETFQPPLYYTLAAAWMHLTGFLGFGYGSLQILSVAISLVTLLAALWVGKLLWKGSPDSPAPIIFGLMIATFPGLVFLSSQITNDGLWTMLMVMLLGLLLQWHQSHRLSDWILLSVIAGLGLLTKSNTVLMLPVIGITVLLAGRISAPRKMKLLLLSGLVITLIAGWIFVMRFVIEGQTSLVGNAAQIHHSILVKRDLKDFIVFNPIQVVMQPFIDDVGAPRREILFEYLLKSAYFGHHFLTPIHLASLVILSALLVLLLAVKGVFSRTLPMRTVLLPTIFMMLLGIIFHRAITPSVANEHIRFILPIVLPLLACAVHTTMQLRGRMKNIAMSLLLGSLLFNTIALLRLSD